MKLAIQQPEHLPWIGFFNKMILADEFIYLDNVQYKKRYFENRNKIRSGDSWEWLTVPVVSKGFFTQKIMEVEIDPTQAWQRKYLNKIQHNYSEAKFFGVIFEAIEGAVLKNFRMLVDLNFALIEAFRRYLNITAPVLFASRLGGEGKGSQLLLDFCIKRNADVYLSGPDGRNYLETGDFRKNNIKIEYHDYMHPEYNQLRSPFISHMSALDLLFNYGKDSLNIIKGQKR